MTKLSDLTRTVLRFRFAAISTAVLALGGLIGAAYGTGPESKHAAAHTKRAHVVAAKKHVVVAAKSGASRGSLVAMSHAVQHPVAFLSMADAEQKRRAEEKRMEHLLRWHKGRHVALDDDDADPKPGQITHQEFYDALKFRQLRYRNSDGKVDHLGRRKAMNQRNALIGSNKANAQARAAAARAGIRFAGGGIKPAGGGQYSLTWEEKGPNNVPGRALAIAIHPTQHNKIWLGTASGGIWFTNNGGVTWSQISDWLPSLAIACITFDPSNPNTMYAGTGEGYFNGDAVQGAGLLKSTDGGQSFNLVASTANWQDVDSVFVSPTDSNVIVCAVPGSGIQRSTDGGATWTTASSIPWPYQIVQDPSDPTHLLATGTDFGNNYVLQSTDQGQTWGGVSSGLNIVSGIYSRIAVQFAASNPSIVYAVVGDPQGAQQGGGSGVWQSQDGGNNWVLRSNGVYTDWYSAPLWVDPTNPNNLVVGSVNLWRSNDAGASFNEISLWYLWGIGGSLPHADMHFFASDPGFNGTANRKFYLACDGGMFETDDIYNASYFGGWNARSIGVHSTQEYGADADLVSGTVIGGTQDNGTNQMSLYSSTSFEESGGDGGFVEIDPLSPNFIYSEYVDLIMFRSSDGGQTQDNFNAPPDAGAAANFIAPFLLDPNDDNAMYAGGASLWRSPNVQEANVVWKAVRPAGSDLISAIAVAKTDSNTVWVGQNNGVVSKTTNAYATTPTWTNLSVPTGGRYIGRIAIDPSNPNTVYVGLGGFQSNNLLVTTDGGSTWNVLTGVSGSQLPAAPVNGIAVHPLNPNWLFVGTEVGLFWSQDGGQHWSTNNAGPASVCVDECRFAKNSTSQLVVATHGRGIWMAHVEITTNHAPVISAIANQTLDQGTTDTFQIPGSDPDVDTVLTYSLVTGPPGTSVSPSGTFTLSPGYTYAGTYPVTVQVTDDGYPALSTTATFSAKVVEVNRPPVVVNPGVVAVTPGGTYTYNLNIHDIDLPVVPTVQTVKLQGPSWVTVSTAGVVTMSPSKTVLAGNYPVNLKTVSLGNHPANQSTQTSFLISVSTPKISGISFLQNSIVTTSVTGGSTVSVQVTLTSPAPSGGLSVGLASRDGNITLPISLNVGAGQLTATATAPTNVVIASTNSVVTATLGANTVTGSLRLVPPPVLTFVKNNGLSTTTSYSFTITIQYPAPKGGLPVSLHSGIQNVIAAPKTVTVPSGQTSLTFTLPVTPPAATELVNLTAGTLGGSQSLQVTVPGTVG